MKSWIARVRTKILIIYAIAALLGVLTGIVGSLFQLAIGVLSSSIIIFYDWAAAFGCPQGLASAIGSMVLVLISWSLVYFVAKEASGSGVQEIEGTLLRVRPIFWRRLLPVKFIGGVLAISASMVVGREGPTIQMGGNLGAMLSEWFLVSANRRDSLIAAGAAAGLATAFNAPLAGVLFVIEEMRKQFKFSFTNFSVVAICCVFATMTLHGIIGRAPAISMVTVELPDLSSLWCFFIFGFVVGFVGLLFNTVLMKTLYRVDKLSTSSRHLYVLLVGLLVGFLAYIYPEVVGGGYGIIERALTISPPLSILIMLIVVRFITTMLCYNVGLPGGIFAPMLALGTLLGVAASHIFQWVMVDVSVDPGMLAVAGMGALFAACVRAPVTGIILVVEMTHNYMMIFPLMITCVTATIVVQLAGNQPIYTQLLHRTLKYDNASCHPE